MIEESNDKIEHIHEKIFEGYKVAANPSRLKSSLSSVALAIARLKDQTDKYKKSPRRSESGTEDMILSPRVSQGRPPMKKYMKRQNTKSQETIKLPNLSKLKSEVAPDTDGHLFFRHNKMIRLKQKVTKGIYGVGKAPSARAKSFIGANDDSTEVDPATIK